jgi:xanthine dehydrogenase accessory factor
MEPLSVLVRGIGDIGSAVAHRLFRAGHRVVIHDVASPAAARRGMAFTDAIFDGLVVLEGVTCRRSTGCGSWRRPLAGSPPPRWRWRTSWST